MCWYVFFFNDTATTEIYTLSLHDALPISLGDRVQTGVVGCCSLDEYEAGVIKKHENVRPDKVHDRTEHLDRKSTRLNSSHANISYAVFCLKKKKKIRHNHF